MKLIVETLIDAADGDIMQMVRACNGKLVRLIRWTDATTTPARVKKKVFYLSSLGAGPRGYRS